MFLTLFFVKIASKILVLYVRFSNTLSKILQIYPFLVMVFIVSEIVFKVDDLKVPFLGEFCSDIESI